MGSVVKLSSTDDYLAPSAVCTKTASIEIKSDTKRKIGFDNGGNVSEKKKLGNLEKVKPSLTECLSCSGCLTSSEEVLLAEQNHDFISDLVLKNLYLEKDQKKILAVSISPQSKASLAVANNLSYEEASKKLGSFFRKMGFAIILDTTLGRELSLIESGKEFVQHFKEKKAMPLIASACPGWVTYVEKQLPKECIKYLSTVKSPMQMTACIVKNYLASKLGVTNPAQVFHLSIQPCFDRKLEAARLDFYNKEYDYKCVDCVLTSGELQELINKEGTPLADLPTDEMGNSEFMEYQDCWRHESSGSDGYLDYVLRYSASEIFGKNLGPLEYKVVRHIDMQEVTLYDDVHVDQKGVEEKCDATAGEQRKPLLRFAFAYGYRMVQSVSRDLRRNKLPYDYMEVMGCPSGCLNGLGQVPSSNLAGVKDEYSTVVKLPVGNHPVVARLYDDWLKELGNEKFIKMMRTQFKHIPKDVLSF